jgi:hypothetical protein
MKQRILIALLTVVVVAAGFAAGIWTERNSCKIPKPPQLLGELSPKPAKDSAPQKSHAPNPAELAAEIERLRPQVAFFRERILELDREMDADIMAILSPTQRQTFEGIVKKYADLREKEEAALQTDRPLTTQEIIELQQQPLYKMLAIVVVPMRLEWNTKDLSLDPTQQEQLRKILEGRRAKFLELVDSSPPPSLTLSKLVPIAQRLVPEKPEKK